MIKKIWRRNHIIAYEFSGRLSDDDYNRFVPQIETMTANYKKLRILIIFKDFEGWDLKALWQNIKFDFKNQNSFEKIAFAGENKFEYWMSLLCKAFTSARVKYFDAESADEALKWLEEDLNRAYIKELEVTPY